MIRRTHIARADRFTIIPNDWARDEALSWKARGLLAWLMSHADGWNTSAEQIIAAAPDGRDAVATGLRELEAAGYLVRTQDRGTGGTFGAADYCLADPGAPLTGYPSTDEPSTGEPSAVNPPPKKNISKNTNTKKNDPPLAALAGPPSARATRLPTGWTPSAVTIAQMSAERPGVMLKDEHLKFVDYWVAQPGQRGTKLDWDATWRNWIRNAAAPRGGAVANGYRHATSEDAVAAVEALRVPPNERVNTLLPQPKEITR